MILRAYRTELDPTAEQRRQLSRHVAGARVAHNWVLERWRTLGGLTRLVAFLRACAGLDDAAGAAAYAFGLGLYALTSGERSETRRPDRKKTDKQTTYKSRIRFRVPAPPGPRPDRPPDSDWIHQQLTEEKNTEDSSVAWLTELSAFAVREGAQDVGKGYEAFLRRLKKHRSGNHSECKPRRGGGCALGEPRFRRSVHRGYHCDQGSAVRVTDRAVLVPKIGWVRVKEHSYLPSTKEKSHELVLGGKVCGLGISEHGGRWYAALRVEVAQPSPIRGRCPGKAARERQVRRIPGLSVGVDSGVRSLAVTSDGQVLPGLDKDQKLLALERRRKLWERRMARRWREGKSRAEQSEGWRAARAEVAKYHRRITEVRDDRVGKAVRAIVDTGASRIVVRGPQIATMLSRGHQEPEKRNALAPRVHAARMGDLARRLVYKGRWAGAVTVEADKDYPSTRRCSFCGAVRDEDPGYAGWSCESCGRRHERELNSAQNLRDFTGGDPGADPGRSGPENPPKGGESAKEPVSTSPSGNARTTAPDGSVTSALGLAVQPRAGALHQVQSSESHHDDARERSSNDEKHTERFRSPTAGHGADDPRRSQSGQQVRERTPVLGGEAEATS